MADAAGTEQETKAAQADLFRIAERDHGLTITALARETGLSEAALRSYNAPNIFARAKMPLWVFVRLAAVIPDDVMSIVFEPVGKCLTSCETPDGDAHALARDGGEYNVAYLNATDPSSEAGQDLSPRERAQLHEIHRRMKTRRVA